MHLLLLRSEAALHLPFPLPFPYILHACGFPGTCCPLINGTRELRSSLCRPECCRGWRCHSFILDLSGAIQQSHQSCMWQLSPRAEGTQRWLVCPHKCIQAKGHIIKSAIYSENVFKTAKWSLPGAEGTLEAISLRRCTSSERFMGCTNA